MKNYVCGICGKEYDNLTSYMACVSKCGEEVLLREREEKQKKRAEELNADINGVKQAKVYYEQKLKEFKEKHPEEYELNFGSEDVSCDTCKSCDCDKVKTNKKEDKKAVSFDTLSVSIVDDGNGEPKFDARINGKKVEEDKLRKLFDDADPDTKHFAKLLRIL